MAAKANHHFIPQFYLRGFSEGTGRQARIFAFDRRTRKQFMTLVRNVGSRRYFNRIEVRGIDPDALENAIAQDESYASVYLQEIIEARSFASPKHFGAMMSLMANLSSRNPRMRTSMEDFHRSILKKMIAENVSSEEIWQSSLERMKERGVHVDDTLAFADVRAFVDDAQYKINIDQTYLIGLEMQMIQPVFDALIRRRWCFVSAPDGFDFITSDNPVVLSWTDGIDRGIYSPGHGVSGTTVFFPLSHSLAILGTFEEQVAFLQYSSDHVVAANTHVARHADMQIYARSGQFKVHLRDIAHVFGSDINSFVK